MKGSLKIVLLLILFSAVPASAQRRAFFPEFVTGAGWNSIFFFTNQGMTKVSGINLEFYGQTGSALSVQSTLGTGSNFSFDLNPGATQVVQITPPSVQTTGYVVITYPSNGSMVRATEVFRHESGGKVDVELGVSQQEQGDHFSFPVEVNRDLDKDINTVVAIACPTVLNPDTQTLIVELIRADGTVQATKKLPMQPGQQLAKYLWENEFFPGLDHFTGSISISSPFGMSILALRQDMNAFGGIGTDGGPILGPFVVNSSLFLNELEPNDDAATAPTISGQKIIHGTIGYAGDMDSYKFQGRAGDIVSVIVDAQTQGSYMDAYVELYNGDFELIARNDQNGMSPQGYPVDDAFILAELPANDTYYIVVSDYWGPSYYVNTEIYNYTLHVKIP